MEDQGISGTGYSIRRRDKYGDDGLLIGVPGIPKVSELALFFVRRT